jgi:hypothetical protein
MTDNSINQLIIEKDEKDLNGGKSLLKQHLMPYIFLNSFKG